MQIPPSPFDGRQTMHPVMTLEHPHRGYFWATPCLDNLQRPDSARPDNGDVYLMCGLSVQDSTINVPHDLLGLTVLEMYVTLLHDRVVRQA